MISTSLSDNLTIRALRGELFQVEAFLPLVLDSSAPRVDVLHDYIAPVIKWYWRRVILGECHFYPSEFFAPKAIEHVFEENFKEYEGIEEPTDLLINSRHF